jgi:OmpA-OmpF porin, OOP family
MRENNMNKQQTIQSFALTAWALASALALTGCGATGSTVSTSNVAHGTSAEKQDVSFPDADGAWLKGGTFIDVEQLRRIGRGMTKNQVRELISYPHFGEGLFGPREWDYLFNFRTGKGDEFVTCHYKLVFKDGLSDAMYWKDPACADYWKPKVTEVVRPFVQAVPER